MPRQAGKMRRYWPIPKKSREKAKIAAFAIPCDSKCVTKLTVNGQPVAYLIDPETPLLWALRDASNLTGAKYGCDTGTCGACTVDMDGRAVRACSISLRDAEGSSVTTIEAFGTGLGHPVQKALVEEAAVLCGFCTPGIVMAAAALLKANPQPSDADIAAAITNFCACGSLVRVRRAIQRAAGLPVSDA